MRSRSFAFYFGVVRAIYWSKEGADLSPIRVSKPIRISICGCIAGMLYLGLFPNGMVALTTEAVKGLR